jgi:hypothetical protein
MSTLMKEDAKQFVRITRKSKWNCSREINLFSRKYVAYLYYSAEVQEILSQYGYQPYWNSFFLQSLKTWIQWILTVSIFIYFNDNNSTGRRDLGQSWDDVTNFNPETIHIGPYLDWQKRKIRENSVFGYITGVLLTDYIKLNPSWEANSRLASQIPYLLWNWKVH